VVARVFALGLSGVAMQACADSYVPAKWANFTKVEGQPLPVPDQWLQDEEARVAHNLKLPSSVPQPVPFDFDAASRKAWLPRTPKVAVQYFNHLCQTEAGEWIFKKERNVEGIYFARPQKAPTSDVMADPYGPEMPWIQRVFILQSDNKALDQGRWFIQPPLYNYRFVEQPHRSVEWQKYINQPYVRLDGYTRERARDQNGKLTDYYKDKDPMQATGVAAPTARYGYTWRGLRRERDREYGIAGGELLIYDLHTKEVLAARRQFLIAGKNPRGKGEAMWEVAASCAQTRSSGLSGEFTQFAFDVLETIEPSRTGNKQK
jgi:hypothetical protein